MILWLLACSAPVPEVPTAEEGWVEAVVLEPERFGALLEEDGRDGWVALHAGRYGEAWSRFASGPSRDRAAIEQLDLVTTLARIERAALVYQTTLGAPKAWDCGKPVPDAPRAALHARLPSDPVGLAAALGEPVGLDRVDGVDVPRWDACAHVALRKAWTAPSPPEGLRAALFGPLDLEPAVLPEDDDVQAARELVQRVDAAVDARRAKLLAHASEEGKALLADLGLLERARAEYLVAEAARADAWPHYRRTLLVLAAEPGDRTAGAVNPPRLWAHQALALLATGRGREALDALGPLVEVHPATRNTREIVSELVVREGMGRQGVARE